MRRFEYRFYLETGKMVWLAALVVGVLTFTIPLEPWVMQLDDCQELTARGIDVKTNGLVYRQFIERVKRNNGVLALGTSESGGLEGLNYFYLLNNDPEIEQQFSAFWGAGRATYMYFPLFLSNPEIYDGLEVLFFVNPTYWRKGLNNFHYKYYRRYNDRDVVFHAKEAAEQRGLYDPFMKPFIDKKGIPDWGEKIGYQMDQIRKRYYEGVQLLWKHYISGDHECIEPGQWLTDSTHIQEMLSTMDLGINTSKDFAKDHPEKFVNIDEGSDFQTRSLKGFMDLTEELGMKVTYFLGPYNEIYAKQFEPDEVAKHEEVLKLIRSIFKEKGVVYIDGSDLSYVTGVFDDHQHHSAFGAHLVALKLKEHYEK